MNEPEWMPIGPPDAVELATISDDLADMSRRVDLMADRVSAVVGGPAKRTISTRLECATRLEQVRDMRARYFGADAAIFGDPGFDILLMVYMYELRGRRLPISAASTAGNSPPTTGLRWVNNLDARGLIERFVNQDDRRSSYLMLTSRGREVMNAYIDAVRI